MRLHHVKKFLLENTNKFLGGLLGILCILQIGLLLQYRGELQLAFRQNGFYFTTQLIVNNFIYIVYLAIASTILLVARKPRRKYSKIGPTLISLAGSFLPHLLIFAPETRLFNVPIVIPILLMFLGASISTMGLLSLRSSFSITPEVRGFVISGIYALVRHPMYLGGFVSVGGFVLLRLSIFSLIIYIGWIMVQVWRTRLEEQLLLVEYPNYRKYLNKTPAFLPLPQIRL